MFDFVRISCCVPKVAVANTEKNTQDIIKKVKEAEAAKSNFIVFPELCITGYTCGDLFFQERLMSGVNESLFKIASATENSEAVVVLGAPINIAGQLYNCSVVLAKGKIIGIVPKTFIPNYNEFYEKRWFSSAEDLTEPYMNSKNLFPENDYSYDIPLSSSLIFETENGIKFGAEICEDLWMPVPPCIGLALHGAELIFNLSASNETIGKRTYRRDMVKQQSSKCYCAYAYVSCGTDESTTDLIFSGHSLVAENGTITFENKKFLDTDYVLTADVDLGKIKADRLKYKSYKDATSLYQGDSVKFVKLPAVTESDGMLYEVRKHPFIPSEKKARIERCLNIFDMQTQALKKRLAITGGRAVIGVSGGLDSTLALLVTSAAVKQLGLPPTNICAVTMPCFGTTDRTFHNAVALMESLGVTTKNISIKEACIQHFKDIGHDINVHDITYENVQARERTQVLMDMSNEFGGIVVGTGDLSELALGWCTYCGDQMSMYGVNAGVPKTLVRWMINSLTENNVFPESTEILKDVADTPISPELLPPDAEGKIAQKTEDVVGPYELHDFFLYYVLRYGFSPAKIYCLANRAFAGIYDRATILKWLKTFYKRFFTQQFKRSCMPDGVKIGSVCLSPRGDWRMPSDAESTIWINEVETLGE